MFSFIKKRVWKSREEVEARPLPLQKRELIVACIEIYNEFANELLQNNSEACKKSEQLLDHIVDQTDKNDPKQQNVGALLKISADIDNLLKYLESEIQIETLMVQKKLNQFSYLITESNAKTLSQNRIHKEKAIESFKEFCSEYQSIAINGLLKGYGLMAEAHQNFIKFFMQSPLPTHEKSKEYNLLKSEVLKSTHNMDEISETARAFFSKINLYQIILAGELEEAEVIKE